MTLFALLFLAAIARVGAMPRERRVDCGYVNISAALCAARGCLFAVEQSQTAMSPPACYYASPGAAISRVHVVFSNHFDAGYTDLAAVSVAAGGEDDLGALWGLKYGSASVCANVINEYFEVHFPLAARVGNATRTALGAPLAWMTQSWLVSLFLDCPPGLGIRCPSPEAVADFEASVRVGDVTWHAFPHNAQLSLASQELVELLIAQTHALDRRFGLNHKTVLSQRDVVGAPRAVLEPLRASKVAALSIGSNGRCLPPNVPPAFIWNDTGAIPPPILGGVGGRGAAALVLWHPYGYGGNDDRYSRSYTRLPGHSEVLWYAWNGDNAGPPASVAEVEARLAAARVLFPDAEVAPSTLEAFVEAIPAEVRAALPVVTADLEDTWVQGAAQAPTTMRNHRALQRALGRCVGSASCSTVDAVAVNFTRLLSKNVEHTFGASLPKFGAAHAHGGYSNAEFRAARAAGDASYAFMERSWRENDQFGVAAPLAALAEDSRGALAEFVREELARLPAQREPDLTGFRAVGASFVLRGWLRLGIDQETGGLSSCVDLRDPSRPREWAAPASPLALLQYQTLADEDLVAFRRAYLWEGAFGKGYEEFGRPNATRAHGASSATVAPRLVAAYADETTGCALLRLKFEALWREAYGAPAECWLRLDASERGALELTALALNKSATRWLEAMYLTSRPALRGTWWVHKLGEWLDPRETADGASKTVQAVDRGVAFVAAHDEEDALIFETPDTPLVNFNAGLRDEPRPFPMPLQDPLQTDRGVSFSLFANGFWNTNYPTFLPFDAPHADWAWRFKIHFKSYTRR